MDSCVTPLRHGGLSLVQTTDFFYPLVEDPYMMVSLLAGLSFLLKMAAQHQVMLKHNTFKYGLK